MSEPVTSENLISQICWAVFGGSLDDNRERLRASLYNYLRSMPSKPITRQAIKRWIDIKGSSVKRPEALSFLYDFLVSSSKLFSEDKPRNEVFDQVFMYTARFANYKSALFENNNNNNGGGGGGDKNTGILRLISNIIQADSHNGRLDLADLFYLSGSDILGDQSYYVLYRYSTINGSILKTFLVCKKPQPNFIDMNSFVHFIRGGIGFQPDVTRESQGLIVRLEKSYYWIGYNYRINADSDDTAADYQLMRIQSKKYPISLELISAEYDDIGLSSGLFPALIMTNAALNQPVISRLAILHLGTSSSLKQFINHRTVKPTEMPISDLSNDLLAMVRRMRSLGCKKFGRAIERIAVGSDFDQSGIADLSNHIKYMIDNTPNSKKGGDELSNTSAIETYPHKSANRPRP